jgi:hypothetical protein
MEVLIGVIVAGLAFGFGWLARGDYELERIRRFPPPE